MSFIPGAVSIASSFVFPGIISAPPPQVIAHARKILGLLYYVSCEYIIDLRTQLKFVRAQLFEMELQKRTEAGLGWNYLPVELDRRSLEQDFQTHILPLVRPAWNNRAIETKVFNDGITNTLQGFHLAGQNDDMVLLRANGEGTEAFLDRRGEIVVMLSLHKAGLIPPVYLELSNGLCYGYVPGRPFSVEDMQVRLMSSEIMNTECKSAYVCAHAQTVVWIICVRFRNSYIYT